MRDVPFLSDFNIFRIFSLSKVITSLVQDFNLLLPLHYIVGLLQTQIYDVIGLCYIIGFNKVCLSFNAENFLWLHVSVFGLEIKSFSYFHPLNLSVICRPVFFGFAIFWLQQDCSIITFTSVNIHNDSQSVSMTANVSGFISFCVAVLCVKSKRNTTMASIIIEKPNSIKTVLFCSLPLLCWTFRRLCTTPRGFCEKGQCGLFSFLFSADSRTVLQRAGGPPGEITHFVSIMSTEAEPLNGENPGDEWPSFRPRSDWDQ